MMAAGHLTPPCSVPAGKRAFKASTRRRWGCDTTLQRAASAGARYFFRERSQRRSRRGVGVRQERSSCAAREPTAGRATATENQKITSELGHAAKDSRTDGGARGATVRKALDKECVPRTVHDLMFAVIRAVKTGQTRLAAYLRGWDTLRPYSEGAVLDPPSIKPCIAAAKNRGTKEVPPRIGLFPCLPVPGIGNSLEDRYVQFILGVSSYVAVSGKLVPLASFRRSTSKEHESLIQHIGNNCGLSLKRAQTWILTKC